MVKYSSRVGKSVAKKQQTNKKSAKKVLEGGSIAVGGSHLTAEKLPSLESKDLTEGTNLQGYEVKSELQQKGGAITLKDKNNVKVDATNNMVQNTKSSSQPSSTSDILSPQQIEDISYPAMIQILHNMDHQTFGHLQGIAAGYLDMVHPLAKPLKHVLGGSFDHPRNISKIATRDVLKSPTAQRLAMALHGEFLDHMQGKPVGGGLFSSLKMLAKKGVSGAKKALGQVGKGAKKAVQLLAKGTTAGTNIAKSISKAINQGLEVAAVLEPAISAAFPQAGEVIKQTQATVKTGQEALQRGIGIAEDVSKGLDPIVQALGPIDAPLVDLGIEPEFFS